MVCRVRDVGIEENPADDYTWAKVVIVTLTIALSETTNEPMFGGHEIPSVSILLEPRLTVHR
jgi:hypothetical protein